jgi:short subunit dehydrogenase-like uncharacterized protein
VQNVLKRQIEKRVKGPSAEQRATGRVHLWGQVKNLSGKTVTATLDVPDGYSFTVAAALACTRGVLSGSVPAGAVTPSRAFGADFVQKLPDAQMSIHAGA